MGYTPLTKIFMIEKLVGASWRSPLYIYECIINPTGPSNGRSDIRDEAHAPGAIEEYAPGDQHDRVRGTIRRLVVEKALDQWLKQHQVESRLYVIGRGASRLYTQFALNELEPRLAHTGLDNNNDYCLRCEVTVQVPYLEGANYVHVDESYDLLLKRVGGTVIDLRNATNDEEIQRAMTSLLLADVNKINSFRVNQSKRNLGQLYNLADETHKRVTELNPCFLTCRGLETSIEPFNFMNCLSFRLKEIMSYFYNPVNMIDLLSIHFEFDVNASLDSSQIEQLNEELYSTAVEMRPGISNDGDASPLHFHQIYRVSEKPAREELCDPDDKTGNVVNKITAEKLFEREFPHVKLKYTHLPCLIDMRGQKLPMEMCWIAPREFTQRFYPPTKETYNKDEIAMRREIFEEDCDEFIEQHTSTFKKFGFQLREFKRRGDARLSTVPARQWSGSPNWRQR